MRGHLPARYAIVLWVVGSLACVVGGAWLGLVASAQPAWHYGALVGAVIAPVLVALYCRTLGVEVTDRPAPR